MREVFFYSNNVIGSLGALIDAFGGAFDAMTVTLEQTASECAM